jgi:hypothetical protein
MRFDQRSRRVLKGLSIWLAALLAGNAIAQVEVQQSIPRTDLYIIFLTLQASDARLREAPGYVGADFKAKAERMGIRTDEVYILHSAATDFANTDATLAHEAREYQRSRLEAREAPDPAIIRSFTARREQLANNCMNRLRSQLSPESAVALDRFLTSTLQASIQPMRLRQK